MSPANRRSSVILALACATLLRASVASAVTPEDEKRAEALFDEGRALMQQAGRLDEGCAKLEASLRIYDRGDTALNLAECHSRQGRTATAWREFDQAIEYGAKVSFKEAITIARERRDALAEKLSRLTVTVADDVAKLEGLEIRLNGSVLPTAAWNEPQITDPGPYELTATAKGRRPFKASVVVGPDKDEKALSVVLEVEPAPPKPAPPTPPPPPARDGSLPILPLVVGGVGVAMLGVSTAFAIDRGNAGSELDAACGSDRQSCPDARRTELEDARSREQRSFGAFVGLGVGGLIAIGVAGVGLGLAIRDGSKTTASLDIGPGSIGLRGAFQ